MSEEISREEAIAYGKRVINLGLSNEILKVAHRFDLINRPYIIFLHPHDAEKFKEILPDIERIVVVEISEFVKQGNVIVIEREKFESWMNIADMREEQADE